jgi:DNA-binding CsgD family transcriptional regulator
MLAGRKKKPLLRKSDRRRIFFWLVGILTALNIMFFFSEKGLFINLGFILLFFIYGGFLPVYLRYMTDLSKLLGTEEENLSFERFCEKHEISKREKEVIHQICKGLSNQEIADKLFISLQTVKDHTHRIYGKIDCTSRAQLIRMVNDTV